MLHSLRKVTPSINSQSFNEDFKKQKKYRRSLATHHYSPTAVKRAMMLPNVRSQRYVTIEGTSGRATTAHNARDNPESVYSSTVSGMNLGGPDRLTKTSHGTRGRGRGGTESL